MDRVVERGCGLDVAQKTVAACIRMPGPDGGRQAVIETFGTTTADILALRDWLSAHGVTHVAMESTGVYWKPLYYLLEERSHDNAANGDRTPEGGRWRPCLPPLHPGCRGGYGGSDSHLVSFVGTVATEFDRDIRIMDDLVEELRAGRCRAVDFRRRPVVAAG